MKGKQKGKKHVFASLALCAALVCQSLLPWAPQTAQAKEKRQEKAQADVSQEDMTAVADSESNGEGAAKAIDGDAGTKWHSSWAEGHGVVPISIVLGLKSVCEDLTQLRYLPRQDKNGANIQWNGDILAYEIWVSSTDSEEGSFQKVAEGSWADDKEEKSATFAPVAAKYVKLVATHTKGNNANEYDQYASAAEINLAAGGAVDLGQDKGDLEQALSEARDCLTHAGADETQTASLRSLIQRAEALVGNPYAVHEELRMLTDSITAEVKRLEGGEPSVVYDAITPNSQWLDNTGAMIQAHGGGVLWDEKTQKYYWYGEHKGEDNIQGGGVIAIGVSCYSSSDLYNWKRETLALPVFNNPAFLDDGEAADDTPLYLAESSAEYQAAKAAGKAVSPYDTLEKYNSATYIAQLNALYQGTDAAQKKGLYKKLNWDSVLERPKVIYSKKNDNYVMWFHKDGEGAGKYSLAQTGIAVSDSPTGPFRFVDAINPLGAESRDMTLFVDDDGKAYLLYSSEDNWTLYIAELNEDYTGLTGVYSRNYVDKNGSKGVYAREAPAIFKYNGSYYIISSGCTGWDPNVMGYSVTDNIRIGMTKDGGNGPFQMDGLKNPCIGTDANISFGGQSTFVLPVQGKEGCFIYMGDKWNKNNLKDSRYQWLPIQIDREEKSLTIAWADSWKVEEMETLNSTARTLLNRAIRAGQEMASSEYDFGQERWQRLQDALELSKKLPFGAAEAQVNAAVQELEQAREELIRWKPLDAAFAEVENRAEAAYTEGSWQKVKDAYLAGKDLGEAALQWQIEQVAGGIMDALAGLEELKVDLEEIPLAGKAIVSDSQQPGNEAEKAVDGDSGTHWHSKWGSGATELPHSLTIDLGQPYEDLYQLNYLPRQDKDSNGIATRYRILTSNSGKALEQLTEADFTEVRAGGFSEDKTEKTTVFRTDGPARYLRFEIVAGVGGFASAAELKLFRGTPEAETPIEPPKPDKVKVGKITVSGKQAKLIKGEGTTLEAAILPQDATDKRVMWKSSNEKVAKVSAQGKVTAIGKGTAVITATAQDGSGVSGSFDITVDVHKVKKILLSSNYSTVAAGKKVTVKAKVATTGKTADPSLTWTTSNRKYATVTKKGVVTTKKAGAGKTVAITASSVDGSKKTASVKIKIVKHAVKKITLTCRNKSVKAGKKVTVKGSVKTTGKTANKKLNWTSSNKKYATVNSKGVVSAKRAGKGKTVTIRATATDGTKKSAKIKIKIK